MDLCLVIHYNGIKMEGSIVMEYILILLGLILIFIGYVKFENINLEVTNYKIRSNKLEETFDGTRFVVVADLHNNTFSRNNDRLIKEINKVNPDFIIIAGDLIVGKRESDFKVALSFLKEISSKYPIYYGFGNHEQRVIPKGKYYNKQWQSYLSNIRDLNVHLLDNESIKYYKDDKSIEIHGLSIDLKFFQRHKIPKMEEAYLEKLIGKLDEKCYNIVIAHNPIYFKDYQKLKGDLILSGHLHGGIVRIPFVGGLISPQFELFPKYDAGYFEENGQVMLVSRGLGTHTIKLRVFNRPELMTVTLERE